MLEKVLESQTNTEKILSGLLETVVSHSTAIQYLEQQMCELSREQHPARKRGLPSDTIPNPKNGSGVEHTFPITTRSSKLVQGADKKVIDLDPIIEEKEVHSDVPIVNDKVHAKEKAVDIPYVVVDTRKQMIKGALHHLTQMYKLTVNFSFLDVVKEMPGFVKFVKDLLMKKRSVQHKTVNLTHCVSSTIAFTTVQKRGNTGVFTILCNIGLHTFTRGLCDNGVSINLTPLAIFKKSGLGMPRPTSMQLQMADRSIKKPVGIIDDVLVQMGKFMLPTDFIILDCAVDKAISIFLGRPFLATGRALMDSKKNKIKFRVNDEEVNFQANKEMKLPKESSGEALAAILVNIDADDMEDYVEPMNALDGLGSYAYHLRKLDLDLVNRTTPPTKTSIVEPPNLELSQLPSRLRYEFVGPNKTLSVIVSSLLIKEHIERLLEILREYRRAIEFNFEVRDRKGSENQVADHLSRFEEIGVPAKELDIDDAFLDEQVLAMTMQVAP
ncbi:uncharacterized protein LOC132607906 [Lycium barbarum]|uniref:uncharacterized protein LOC132607906 n=1 Tax=Lycium barbarum TaxID=112863 RepID=UPI00293EE922|nr:uncharacterized protein LOC132607906 [Lycium barbarum]